MGYCAAQVWSAVYQAPLMSQTYSTRKLVSAVASELPPTHIL
jgi:hypothetical protein